MAAMIIRIKASSLPGLWTLSSKYLFAGTQLQASQKRYFAAIGYRPLNSGPNLFAFNRLKKKCNPQFSSKPFKTKLKELMDYKPNPEFLKYQQKIGDVIKSLDRNQLKRIFKIMGPLSMVLLTLAYIRGDSKHQLVTEIEADKERIKQKLQDEEEAERELKPKKPNASHVTPFSKVLKKKDKDYEKDYALPSYTSAPKKRKDLIDSDSLSMPSPHNDMQESDKNSFIQKYSKFQSPKSQVETNVAPGNDDLIPCFEPSPCKDVQKTEDAASKSYDQIPCSISPPCKDFKKPERSKSNSLIASIKSPPPFKGVQKSETLASKSNHKSKSPPCMDKSEVLASKNSHLSPCVKSPSSWDIQKTDEFVPMDNSHNHSIKSPTTLDFPKSDGLKSENNDSVPCSKTPPRIDVHKAKEWSLSKCSQIKTPPGINLGGNSDVANESHDACSITSPCIVQTETNESSANESKLTDGTDTMTTLPCTETTHVEKSKGLKKPKRMIRFSSPEKPVPVKENHSNAPDAKTPKIPFKKMQSEKIVNDKINSPQNITKEATEPSSDFAAENISQNNATSSLGPSGGAIVQKSQVGNPEMVCTINPEEIEMDLSTTTNRSTGNPEKDSKKGSAVNKSPIGNFMKKDCVKPEKVEKKLCLKSNFKEKEKNLEKDNTNYKRREVIEVNDKVCVDDK